MALVLAIGLIGSAFAAFTDTETSSGNTFTAGYVDLEMNGSDSPGASVTIGSLAPGTETGEYTITFYNNGSLAGILSWGVAITGEADNNTMAPDGNGSNVSAADFAANLYVTSLLYSDSDTTDDNILAGLQVLYGTNVSLAELAGGSPFSDSSETVSVYETITLKFKFTLDSTVGNAYQGDGVEMSLTGTLTNN